MIYLEDMIEVAQTAEEAETLAQVAWEQYERSKRPAALRLFARCNSRRKELLGGF